MYVVPIICFFTDICTSKKIQRAELFSKFSIPPDTQIISTILGKNEQCFPNMPHRFEKYYNKVQ